MLYFSFPDTDPDLLLQFKDWNQSPVEKKKHCQVIFLYIFIFFLQGLFRIAAGASKLKKLKAALDCSTSQLEEFYSDPHAVAGTTSSTNPQKVKPSGADRSLIAFLFIHRSPEVLPQGTSWTSNDFWPVRRVATGLQVRRHTDRCDSFNIL